MSQLGLQVVRSQGGCLPVWRLEGLLPIHAGAQGGELMINVWLIDQPESRG